MTHDESAQSITGGSGLSLIVMGVSGSGKTTVGTHLASRLGCPFVDGDDYHPTANIEKMSAGIPLQDEDRRSWLDSLRRKIASLREGNRFVVVACSALKESYRRRLSGGQSDFRFLFLEISPRAVRRRFEQRKDHFMPAALIESQFEVLEPPSDAVVLDAEADIQEIVEEVLKRLAL